jgi:hypothetical protein
MLDTAYRWLDNAMPGREWAAGDTFRLADCSEWIQTMTLQRLLGVELPIIQAPMAGVQGSAVAVAVSNAGGLGSLPCAMLSLDAIRGVNAFKRCIATRSM